MRENTLKQRLYAGKAAFGVMCTFPSPPVVEMLGHLGFGRPAGYGFKGATADYAREANRQTLVPGVDVYFIGSGDLSQSMGHTGQPTHPDVQHVMERGIKTVTGAGRIAGCSCPDTLIPSSWASACSTSTAA